MLAQTEIVAALDRVTSIAIAAVMRIQPGALRRRGAAAAKGNHAKKDWKQDRHCDGELRSTARPDDKAADRRNADHAADMPGRAQDQQQRKRDEHPDRSDQPANRQADPTAQAAVKRQASAPPGACRHTLAAEAETVIAMNRMMPSSTAASASIEKAVPQPERRRATIPAKAAGPEGEQDDQECGRRQPGLIVLTMIAPYRRGLSAADRVTDRSGRLMRG